MALALLTLSIAGCATASSSSAPPACPREVEYSRQQEEAAADEMEEIRQRLGRDGIIVGQFMPDYGRLRDQTRACRGQK
jgi:hypothetical protein